MSDRFNCPIHGVRLVDSYNDGCPDCKHAEWELRNAVSEAAYAKNNPGDYDCPHCKYRSLRAGASRCPLCHGEIGAEYWNAVWTREKANAEREAAASKAAAERKRAMEAAAEAELIRTAPERAAILGVKRFFACAAGILGGGIAGFVVAMILGLPLILICGAMGNEGAANTIMTGIIVIGAIFGGVVGLILVKK